MKEKSYALITGASQGLGKAFALELTRRKHHLILVSLPGEGLEVLGTELRTNGIEVICFEKDLTKRKQLFELTNTINSYYHLDILINNAGFGGGRHFLEVSAEYLEQMIRLNVNAVTLLIHQLLPNLLQREKAYVLNVSSKAAMSPIGFKTIYPATKSFIYMFTRSLEKEFAKSNVTFSVVSPGPMMTNDDVINRMEHQGYMARQSILSTEKVAQISIKKMLKGRNVITLTFFHKLQWVLLHIVPERLKMAILSKIAKNEVISES